MFYRLVLSILAVWRITHLLFAEDGPWDIVIRIRIWVGSGLWGQLLDCFYCLSVWIAAPIAFFAGKKIDERILLWPALSAGAILLERITGQGHLDSSDFYQGDGDFENVMLRK